MEGHGRRTLLYDEHLARGARMMEFAGWELPAQYAAGATAEHQAVRTAAGLFDIDHMGQFSIAGPDALPFLNAVLSIDVERVACWGAHYALLPYADGGLVDDVFLYHLEESWWLVVNAANHAKAWRWLQVQARGFTVRLADISDATYMLALQGPLAQRILQRVTDADLTLLPFHTAMRGAVAGAPTLIGSTGYTGEYGYELYLPADSARLVWHALLDAGAVDGLLPAGLIARDSLRFEAGLALYGHEISAEIDPISARLKFFVHFEKGPFVGRDALLKIALEGPSRQLVGLEMLEPAVPRTDYPVLAEGVIIGQVTSGMKSPTLGRFLAMALVPTCYAAVGTTLEVQVREHAKRAAVAPLPFYRPAYRKNA